MKLNGCEHPDGLLYDVEAGTWAKGDGDDFTVGLAPLLVWTSGGYTSVTFKPVGGEVGARASLGSVDGPRHFDVVRAPFDCSLVAVNSRLREEPGLLNRDPYGEGWFARVRRLGGPSSLKPLEEVSGQLEKKLGELGVRCFAEFPDRELHEIGVECSAVLVRLDEVMVASQAGTVVHLVTDDPTAEIEIERWKDQTGNHLVDTLREGNLRHFVVRKK